MTRIRNQLINSLRRKKTANDRKIDIEDEYHVKQDNTWRCMNCGSEMVPYRQDEYGDIVMSCTNQYCYKSKDWDGTLTTRLKKLTKQMQMNSKLNFVNYDGSFR